MERTVSTFKTETQVGRDPTTETDAVSSSPSCTIYRGKSCFAITVTTLYERLVTTGTDFDEPVVAPVREIVSVVVASELGSSSCTVCNEHILCISHIA